MGDEARTFKPSIDPLQDACEKLSVIILNKFFKERLAVFRASKYDYYANYVDTILLDTDGTGKVLCGLHPSVVRHPDTPMEEWSVVLEINRSGGTSLKYGMEYELESVSLPSQLNKQMRQRLGPVKNIPLFLNAIPPGDVEDGVRSLSYPPSEEMSSKEQEIVRTVVTSINSQIGVFREMPDLNAEFTARMRELERILNTMIEP